MMPTLVEENYFVEIEKFFRANPVLQELRFLSHQIAGLNKSILKEFFCMKNIWNIIKERSVSGYPYPMFTVGSAFAIAWQLPT